MLELKSHTKISKGSDFSFGVLFAFIFLFIALFPLIRGETINIYFFVISILLFCITFFFRKLLYFPNLIWIYFGIFLSIITTNIFSFIMFFLIFFPIGIFFKIYGRDVLNKKIDNNIDTFWQNRTEKPGPMNKQF